MMKMNKILIIFLLGIVTTFAQTTKVMGTTLTYNKKTKTMLLSMSDTTFLVSNNSDLDTEVKIVREYDLTMKINGVEYSMTEPYFWTYGYRHDMFWAFTTERPANCKSISKSGIDYTYKFSNVVPGEYILIVTRRCDEKYVLKRLSGSIIVR
jgi:hypothetical protein